MVLGEQSAQGLLWSQPDSGTLLIVEKEKSHETVMGQGGPGDTLSLMEVPLSCAESGQMFSVLITWKEPGVGIQPERQG